MILLKSLLNEIEQGGTAMHNKTPAPAIVALYNSGKLGNVGDTILDYGAGHGRNADFLRKAGLKVYAYDPYNGTSVNGYNGISNILPTAKFKIGFTCFVLNVLNKKDEAVVISKVDSLCNKAYHIVRNNDIIAMIQNALLKKNPLIVNSFKKFGGNIDSYTIENIWAFAKEGTETSKGFQRIPTLEDRGFSLISKKDYKIYTK